MVETVDVPFHMVINADETGTDKPQTNGFEYFLNYAAVSRTSATCRRPSTT